MKIIVTGATGFIGKAAVIPLARLGHEITAVVRRNGAASALAPTLKNADAVVHLAGEPVANSRWSAKAKAAIRASRVEGTRKIVGAISKLSESERPKTLVSGSAIRFYGDRSNEALTERSSAGSDFLAQVTQEWELEAVAAEKLGVRVVRLRTGIVLGARGGALKKMQPVISGDGLQWMSWIHLDDEVRFIEFALKSQEVAGAYNLTAPNPARNRDFTKKLAKARGLPFTVSAPKFLLKAALGEMSGVLLSRCQALPNRAVEQGFLFSCPTVTSALDQIYPPGNPLEQHRSVTQFVPKPVEEVFDFFSRAENPQEITPPWLNFHIVGKSAESVTENTLINHRFKTHGVPARWQSKIERWSPYSEFVDTQTKGPYARWHHTLVHDDVIYKVPGGAIGKALLSTLIRRDITQIFAYRKKKIAEVFKS